jgi:hypothetical protein
MKFYSTSKNIYIRNAIQYLNRAVVAHREQRWLLGSYGGSLVLSPDYETAVLGLNPSIFLAYSGLPVLRWAAIWDGFLL